MPPTRYKLYNLGFKYVCSRSYFVLAHSLMYLIFGVQTLLVFHTNTVLQIVYMQVFFLLSMLYVQ